MKNFTKVCALVLLWTFSVSTTYGSVETVSCDINSAYAANSCDQCFTGWAVAVGENKGLLTDVWENNSENSQLLYKEEQEMPNMISLGGASWSEVKASELVEFWQYTPEFDALYDEVNLWYKLDAGNSVTWLKSSLGSAYQLVSNSTMKGENVGMLVYDISTHTLEAEGSIDTNTDTHRECVLFTSGEGQEVPPSVPQNPELPATGPEHILLLAVALLLGFGFLTFRRK